MLGGLGNSLLNVSGKGWNGEFQVKNLLHLDQRITIDFNKWKETIDCPQQVKTTPILHKCFSTKHEISTLHKT